jgi:hypothetical protein
MKSGMAAPKTNGVFSATSKREPNYRRLLAAVKKGDGRHFL